VQRITRYPLLLRQILQYTSPDQDFAAVQNALSEAENITAAINESVRDAEGDERLRVLSEDLWIGGEGSVRVLLPGPDPLQHASSHWIPVKRVGDVIELTV
jgi:hypothetical protein